MDSRYVEHLQSLLFYTLGRSAPHDNNLCSSKDCANISFCGLGNPGTGKTVLASSIVQQLQESASKSDSEPFVCYHFFSSDASRVLDAEPVTAYRSILSQILHQNRHNTGIFDKFLFAWNNRLGQLQASQSELVELLQLCCEELVPIYLILDGIDECSDYQALIRSIRTVLACPSIKVLLTSRPTVPGLSRGIPAFQQALVDKTSVSDDIKAFMYTKICALIEEEDLPPVEPTHLVDQLNRGANGMFLWAALMLKLLSSPVLSPQQRLAIVREVIYPEGLELMYNRILNFIEQSGRLRQGVAMRVFCWLTYARTPVKLRQLYEILHMSDLSGPEESSTTIEEFREKLNVVCGSMVETYQVEPRDLKQQETLRGPQADAFGVRFIHLSVFEYFKQSRNQAGMPSITTILQNEGFGHSILAQDCLRSMIANAPTSTVFNGHLTRYAVFNFVYHLEELGNCTSATDFLTESIFTEANADLATVISQFLESPLVVTRWIFSHYAMCGALLFGDIPFDGLKRWIRWLQVSRPSIDCTHPLLALHERLTELATDIQRLVEEWGEKLRNTPSILWDEVPAFLQSRFICDNTYTTITHFTTQLHGSRGQSSRSLCSVSMTSSDGLINCVVSVWPSKAFEERWKGLKARESVSRVEDVCRGWVILYEAWSVKTKSRLTEAQIPLEEAVVWLQMRQSLHELDRGDWRTAFPMTISNDLRSVVVLRTLYVFSWDNKSSNITWDSATLPIDFTSGHVSKWSEQLEAFDPTNPAICGRPLLFIHRDRYTYSIGFSPNGRYLSFRDTLERLNDTLAVFEISTQETLQVKLVNFTQLFWGRMSTFVSFHPVQDVLAFSTAREVRLWKFKEGALH